MPRSFMVRVLRALGRRSGGYVVLSWNVVTRNASHLPSAASVPSTTGPPEILDMVCAFPVAPSRDCAEESFQAEQEP